MIVSMPVAQKGARRGLVRRKRILLVDDDGFTGSILCRMLVGLGYSPLEVVSTGEEAIRQAEIARPDLVLMDVVLEGEMNGIQAAKEIRDRFNIPTVYLTAHSDKATLEEACHGDLEGFLLKPCSAESLRATIEAALKIREMEGVIQEKEQWISSVLRSIGEIVIATDLEGKVVSMNPSAEAVALIKPDPGAMAHVDQAWSLMRGEERIRLAECVRNVVERNSAVLFHEGFWLQTPGMVPMPVEGMVNPIRDGQGRVDGAVIVLMDIQDKLDARRKLKSYHEALRAMSLELSLAEEKERQGIATQIHDEIMTTLALAKIKISATMEGLGQAESIQSAKEASELIDRTIQEAKSLMFHASPPLLYDLGLDAALEWLGEQMEQRRIFRFSFRDDGRVKPLGLRVKVVAFQCIRELLENLGRHAKARNVRISLYSERDTMRVVIRDDGTGDWWAPSDPTDRDGSWLSIFGIRERLDQVGICVESRQLPAKGTEITLLIPLAFEPGARDSGARGA